MLARILLALALALVIPATADGAVITRVIDGDTVEVNGRTSVRLIGIDTPEVYFGAECGGHKASAYAQRFTGARVRLRTDPTQDRIDRYGRLLAYVDMADGSGSMNAAMVRSGWAMVYVYDGVPFQRTSSFRRVQAGARVARRGVWRYCRGDFHSGR